MKADELIALLARGAGPAPRRMVEGRVGTAVALGALASAGASVAVLGLNPGLAGMGWSLVAKFGYIVALLLAAAWLAARAARPGAPLRPAARGVAAVVLVMALVTASMSVSTAAGSQGMRWLFGQSWTFCPIGILALSVPAWLAAVWALRGLAPTRPRWAGFAAGLLAGGAGALGYALHCSETSPLFVLAWYSLGMLAPAAAGAVLGPRLLRW